MTDYEYFIETICPCCGEDVSFTILTDDRGRVNGAEKVREVGQ